MLLDKLIDIVGPNACVTDEIELEPNLTEWRDIYHGKTFAMISPASTKEVSDIVRVCSAAGVGIVPQGGNTGLCGGAIPDESGEQVLLSLSRLNRIRSMNPDNFSMIAEAGCVLATLQQAALDVGRYFPLSLGAEGSCQIGGNLSTNAGGINVIRYGTARQQVLGLEVVLADGTVIDALRSLRKDTAGYDLKQLFVGSEGTLGIITAACLRLYPHPGETATAMIALRKAEDAVTLLGDFRVSLADRIEAFELISKRALEFVQRHMSGAKTPVQLGGDWYLLIEVALGDDRELLYSALESALQKDLVLDAIVAKNAAEAETLWRMRHSISEAQKFEGPSIKHDIAVPIANMQQFLISCEEKLTDLEPDAKPVIFGHVGDGNLHYNLTVPKEIAEDPARATRITTTIYDLVAELDGSFSAEHGIGVRKREYLERYRGNAEIELMRRLKTALDPLDTLNPGKVI